MTEPIDIPALDTLLASLLRGDTCTWPSALSDVVDADAIGRRISFHGVSALLYQQAREATDWPQAVVEDLRDEALSQAFWEDSHRQVVAGVIDALDQAGIAAVLLKGTALAYSLYPDPAFRRRGDTDLLVRERDLRMVQAVLRKLGFERQTGYLFQQNWQHQSADGFVHTLDLHWRVINSPLLHGVLDAERSFARAAPLPRLHPAARGADVMTLFIHGCINQAWHRDQGYYSGNQLVMGGKRLVWALDNHLLIQRFTEGDWQDLLATAQGGLARQCLQGLLLAQATMHTEVPPQVIHSLERTAHSLPAGGPPSQFATIAGLWASIKAINLWRDRLRYVAIIAFPPEEHMRNRYPAAESWPLPLLYLRRFLSALSRLPGTRHKSRVR